ncbi:hypothetical protein DPMN_034426 [Dreissena polymorpha]|uniref:PKD domain-containing protein n=1 Tax=Dreissena polymorpha TaxID=45954 RepID=A0A9D4RLZ7_DREPO|nr:hypothetical protein DPMN_034426 [Dreissena polymorpha]
MFWCSRFNTTILFDDGSMLAFYTELLLAPENITKYHAYTSPGIYQLSAVIENPVGHFEGNYSIVVQYPVRNLELRVKSPQILPIGSSINTLFNLTFLGLVEPATNASIMTDFKDGTIIIDPFLANDSTPIVFGMWHPYIDAGTYNVSMNVSNLVSWIFLHQVVDVDEKLYEVVLTPALHYVITNTFVDLLVTMLAGTRATCLYESGDGSPTVLIPCSRIAVASVSHQYATVGVYHPSVFANNSVGYVFVYSSIGPIFVQNPVVGFKTVSLTKIAFIGPPYTPTYELTLKFELLFDNRELLPTNASYKVDFGDGYVTSVLDLPPIVKVTNYNGSYDLMLELTHTYIHGGNFSIDITIWNLVSNVTYSDTFDIYEAIANLRVNTFGYDAGVKMTGLGPEMNYFAQENPVWFQASHDKGSHVSYFWIFNDSLSESTDLIDYVLHNYLEPGMYNVQLIASNYIGSATVYPMIHVQRSCKNIAISSDTPRSKNTTFDFPVFPGNIATDACYMIDFKDNSAEPSQYQFFGNLDYCKTVPEWSALLDKTIGHFVAVSSWELEVKRFEFLNQPTTTGLPTTSTVSITTTIKTTTTMTTTTSLATTTSTPSSTMTLATTTDLYGNFTTTTGEPTTSTDPYYNFTSSSIAATTTGTTTSTTDGTTTITTTTLIPTTTVPLSYNSTWNITIQTKYMIPGMYATELKCRNWVSQDQAGWETGVTKGQCWWPYVNVSSANPCKAPMCDEAVPTMRKAYRSEKLIIYSNVTINCTATKIAFFWWRVFKQNLEGENETEVTDLKGADYYSIGARNLILTGNTLEYGLYRFELNVSMNETMGMDRQDSLFLRIVETPLVAKIAGGEYVMRPWGDFLPLEIDGGTFSYDPDMEDPADKTGMEFIWLCRRTCESWPQEFTEDYNVAVSMPPNNCSYSDVTDRGCNKVDMFDSSGTSLKYIADTIL